MSLVDVVKEVGAVVSQLIPTTTHRGEEGPGHHKHVSNNLRPRTIDQLLGGMPLVFQPGKSVGLNATYHFTFTGAEDRKATIVIHNKNINVEEGHIGEPGLRVTTDTKTWLGFLAKEKNLAWALLRRRIRLKGSPKLLIAFGKCFPS